MAIDVNVDILESQTWPQGDARDPLGVWGARLGVTGDASGGGIKVAFVVPAPKRGARVYTVYSATFAQLTGTTTALVPVKSRILTNWPNIDPVPGVQGFGTLLLNPCDQDNDLTAPVRGPVSSPLITPNDRFILCYDPRQQTTLGPMAILELAYGKNEDLATFSFEGYGYWWDRSVMDTPGGPRHPGSS